MKFRLGTLLTIGATWIFVALSPNALAQVTPSTGSTPPDDTPKINLGITLFADYTYVDRPKLKDSDNRDVNFNSFSIGRSYINVTGSLSRLFAFRVTPDITRATGADGLPTGSYNFRLKLAYGQFNLDDWLPKGTWLRLGIHDTPYVSFAEGIYRYRFQGTIFVEREGFLGSADAGLSGRFNFPGDYGDIHLGVYNGEGFGNSEANDQKAFQVRATLRPAPKVAVIQGLRLTGFYDADHYVKDAKRERFVLNVTFEHPRLNAGFDYLDARDQTSISGPELHRSGWSAWITPRTSIGFEALLRYDELNTDKDKSPSPRKRRVIAGLAYWPAVPGGKTVAFLIDYESVKFEDMTPLPGKEKHYALHALFTF